MDLNDYFYFVHVVEKRGFAPAGRALGVPKSRLSRHIRQLEEHLGARLIQRTSRRFTITDAGDAFYRHARAALNEVAAAEAAVRRQANTLSGTVRLSCSVGVAQFAISTALSRFMAANPQVKIVQQVTNQTVDLVETGIDMAIRGHADPLPPSSLIQSRLAPVVWHLFAGPSYLDSAGTPARPEDLETHAGLKLGWRPEAGNWSLRGPGDTHVSIPFTPLLCSDDMVTLKQCAADGQGIVALPAYVCREEVARGKLVRVLPDWTAGDAQLSLLTPSRRGQPPAVKALSAILREHVPGIVAQEGV
ncbi:LysR substrate-binding domain-containing protein [Pyruvatibacter mobilis]|uniref:LysR substrate-binding domain-containing protein n=1 Tax=Pyruvatibacter mobilis TaxID=1712261 RepID=UPI003C79F2DB